MTERASPVKLITLNRTSSVVRTMLPFSLAPMSLENGQECYLEQIVNPMNSNALPQCLG